MVTRDRQTERTGWRCSKNITAIEKHRIAYNVTNTYANINKIKPAKYAILHSRDLVIRFRYIEETESGACFRKSFHLSFV